MIRFTICILAALLLVGARPLPTPPMLPPATIHLAPRVQQPDPTPAVTISGTVEGRTSGGSPAPIGIYTAYGRSIAEAAANADILEAQVRTEATARAVAP